MRDILFDVVDWTPAVLPCAPRPINGELLSSWARRLAAGNGITLAEICACAGDLQGGREKAAIYDYGAPKPWRRTLAALARIPESWVWVLDLQQQFPACDRAWFLHHTARPDRILSGFCPECFHEQVDRRRTLHLKAEWAVALVTRCFEHQLPLYRYCPWCGRDQPVHFQGNAVQCLYCEDDLSVRRRTRTPPSPEPLIVAFERAVVAALAGKAPDPTWGGELTARGFRGLLRDLIWILTTGELIHPSSNCAVVDRVVARRFLPKDPYGHDFETPFHARSWAEREAVVCAVLQVLLGPRVLHSLDVSGYTSRSTAHCHPFVEILMAVPDHRERLWTRIRQWPEPIQHRAGEALRFLQSRRKPRQTAVL